MSVQAQLSPKLRTPRTVNFTDSAAKKVAQLISEEQNPELKLRAFITGGGCSGFQYGFTFDEKINEGDTQVTKQVCLSGQDNEKENDEESGDQVAAEAGVEIINVVLLIDPMSYQYLVGADIDYKEDLDGARFVIRNPNAKTTCGCGQSFSV